MLGEYSKTLFEIFNILGLSEDEKLKAVDIFQKKVASEVLILVKQQLPTEYQQWIEDHLKDQPDPADPKAMEIKNKIAEMFSEIQLSDMSRVAFKKLVSDYVDFMSDGLSAEKTSKLKAIVDGI